MGDLIAKIRPQILLALICATIIAVVGAWIGRAMNAPEIVTAALAGAFGVIGTLGMKILEDKD